MNDKYLLRVLLRSGESMWITCTQTGGREIIGKWWQWSQEKSPAREPMFFYSPDMAFAAADVIGMYLKVPDVPAGDRMADVMEESLKLHKREAGEGESWKGKDE